MLDEVAAATGETVHLGRLEGSDVIYTAKRESIHPLRMHSAVGRRLPAYATSLGRALLAELPLEQRRGMVPEHISAITPNTTTDKDAVLDIIDRAVVPGLRHRERGVLHGRALLRCRPALRPTTPSTP